MYEFDIFINLIKDTLGYKHNLNISELELNDNEWDNVFKLASEHSLLPLVIYSLKKNNILCKLHNAAFLQQSFLNSVYSCEIKKAEIDKVCKIFEENQIKYIKLKGARIKDYYPEDWMRTSSDIDILIERENINLATELLINTYGYSKYVDNYHDVTLISPSKIILELHFSINENIKSLDKVLSQVWEYSYPLDNGTEYLQTNEYFMFHNIAHMAYHFMTGGCGIRACIDCFLLKEKMDYDKSKVMQLCNEAGIGKFYTTLLQLLEVWFSDAENTEETTLMGDFIIKGGNFGTITSSIATKQSIQGGKLKYIRSRLFVTTEHLSGYYPIVKKYKFLIPIFQVKRWFDRTKFRGGLNSYKEEFANNSKIDSSEVENAGKVLEMLNFK